MIIAFYVASIFALICCQRFNRETIDCDSNWNLIETNYVRIQ